MTISLILDGSSFHEIVFEMKKVAIYARVSTDSQTVANQLQELHAVAQRNGWIVVFSAQGAESLGQTVGRTHLWRSLGTA